MTDIDAAIDGLIRRAQPSTDDDRWAPQLISKWGSNLPSALQIEITSHCNLHCKMCPLTTQNAQSSLQAGHISEVMWAEIVPLAREVGQVIIAGFGEPLTNPRCLWLLQQLDACGVRMSLTTNGTALTSRIATELVRLSYLTHINISIDSPNPRIYRDVRGGDVQRAFRGLQNLLACIDNFDRVSVSSIIMRSTISSLVGFPPLLAQYGVKRYVLQGLLDYNDTFTEEISVENDRTFTYHINEIKRSCRQHTIELVFTLPQRLNPELRDSASADRVFDQMDEAEEGITRQCFLPWEIPYIDKDGEVFPCCIAAAKGGASLGSCREDSLSAIWNGAKFHRFRKDILDGRTTPSVCQSCKAAPLGEHPLRLYRARILQEESFLDGPILFKLVVENIGKASWTQDDMIRIGTSNPRDRSAPCVHPTWLSDNRIVSFSEAIVRPREKATFIFQITPIACGREVFQLVADGKCWLPDTRFSISS